MIKTYKEVQDFNAVAGNWLRKDPINPQTKLGYAINKVGGVQIKNIVKEYGMAKQEVWYEMVEKKAIDLALTDKVTGAILLSPKDSERPYQYDKEGLKALMDIEKEFYKFWEGENVKWDSKEFEINPHYSIEIPETLTQNEVDAMKGFVIDPTYELPIK